ncbi:hypothetical protein HGG64_00680 [Mycoplasma phocoeninasale]|uniref:Uncharacterized protein n=1 Tax=Mycoplasma phocoeninasale TaxID=2726117 RepID=A0A858U1E3_9MOLU|nr:hypothetical protein [Mycoplasma phocoeninasale]QJG66232.1 hypothetical protein HGG64_00680 [Mycoplasma phocoeninasale]
MFCSRLLMPIDNFNDMIAFPILRTVDMTVYIKLSKKPFHNATKCLDKIEQPTNYDTVTFGELYYEEHEFYLVKTSEFDEFTENVYIHWNYLDDEKDYQPSYFILSALKDFQAIINREKLTNATLIIMDVQPNQAKPYYVYCDPEIAKQELDYFFDNFPKRDALLINASSVLFEELPIANKKFFDPNDLSHLYLTNQIGLYAEKNIKILKDKLRDVN